MKKWKFRRPKAAVDIPVGKEAMRRKWYEKLNWVSLPLQALGSCIIYYLMEVMSRHSFASAWEYMTERPLVFLYNAGILFTSSLLVYLVRRRFFMRTLLAVFWLLLGAVNGIILANRVTPFTGPDLQLLSDAMKISGKYLSPTGTVVAGIVLAFLAVFLLVLLIKGPKYRGKIRYRYVLPLILVGAAGLAGTTKLALEKRVLSNYFGNIAFAYEDYGYPYCLATTIFNTGISQPQDYSSNEIKKIMESGKKLSDTGEERPNIIFLQLESFFDPELVNYLNISEDPIPYFRQLMKEYSSGYYKVPSVGAGTANTEFESITGMSMHYFGPGEYPYKSILKETTCESAPYVLKSLGYSAHAIHNNEANFYGRKSIFPNLGFDTFTSEEYMVDEDDKNPLGWVRDRVLTKSIMECLESTDTPDYIYTISVQGHGAYPDEPILEDPQITVSGAPTEALNNKWEYYCNEIREMDDFIRELIAALSEYNEDVVLVMYGDHLPTMELTVEDVENKYLFQTEYVIWDNMGLEKKDENLASYQMAAEVMDRVGIHEGTIFRYHQARRNSKNYQVDLETLQYDVLYGKGYAYDEEKPYKRVKMRMGLYDITLDSVTKISDYGSTYYIQGSNYTPSTEVKINGEWYETTYINPTTLLVNGYEFQPLDRITVCQRSNSSTRKALTSSYERLYYVLEKQ